MYEKPDFLIEPGELRAAMAAGALVLDTRRGGAYERGSIPGAVPFSTYDVFVPDTTLEGMTAFAVDMASRYSIAGAERDRPIVVYENDTGMRAARELWILEYLGHRSARMLHGGLRQWVAEGGSVVTHTDVATVRSKRFKKELASGGLATAHEVLRRAGNPGFAVIDVRDDLEWAGQDDTPCCARRGHIPHAVHIEWTEFLENGRFKSPEAIRALLVERGIDPEWEQVPYCHRGARSANTYYALRHAGCTAARNFIGSWHEWSAHGDFPVETSL